MLSHMQLTRSLGEHIRQREERLLQSEARRSRQTLDGLLAAEFIEFASDGVAYNKVQVIDALGNEAPCQRTLTDFQMVALAENVVFVTYRATRQNAASNEIVNSLRSSIWTQRDGRWQLLFHQGTASAAP